MTTEQAARSALSFVRYHGRTGEHIVSVGPPNGGRGMCGPYWTIQDPETNKAYRCSYEILGFVTDDECRRVYWDAQTERLQIHATEETDPAHWVQRNPRQEPQP